MKSLLQLSMIGKKAPEFILKDENGKLKSLSDYGGSWLILYFYPKDMTAGCSLEAQEFRDHEYELNDLNAQVVGVSADDVASHKRFCDSFVKLAELHPGLTLDLKSFDEGWNFACVGQFNGRKDFAEVKATPELYEAVYGEKYIREDEEPTESVELHEKSTLLART